MRKLISIFIAIALLVQVFDRAVIFYGYLANKAYIAGTLCENRSKPELHCNGKCYLARQLKKADKKETGSPVAVKGKVEISPAVLTKIMAQPVQIKTNIVFVPYLWVYSHTAISDIFHPPLFV